jgi:3-deoxy-7-phosphoheptulonate synthase
MSNEAKEATKDNRPWRLVARDQHPAGSRVRIGGVEVGGREFVVAAGPCAVESREQMVEVARAVARAGAQLLRGGAYKPRTSPYAFQGLGEEGLRLLAEAGREAGLGVVTEVMAAEDVPTIVRYADALQVGARNVQNYSLLKALGAAGKPVLLKRGFATTIDELLGAAEYIVAHGNPDVVLCERGIRTFETATRNTLDLNAVAVLKSLTHLPVVVDPSHGTGRRDLVVPLSRAAAAVGADGLLVEVHPHPELALSDGSQSLPPAHFASLMRELTGILAVRERTLTFVAGPLDEDALGVCRERIDSIDEAILGLLNGRAELALRVGRIKQACGRKIDAPEREAAVIERALGGAQGALEPAAVERLFRAIIDESKRAEILLVERPAELEVVA